MSLLVQCTKREAFHRLRTIEQLGYMVRFPTVSVLLHGFFWQLQGRLMARHTAEDAAPCRCGCPLGMC